MLNFIENINFELIFHQDREELKELMKSLDITSSKIIDEDLTNELLDLCEILPDEKIRLVYRASKHGFSADQFHFWCDDVPNTLMIIKSTCGSIFGGYTNAAWDKSNSYKNDPEAFLFSLVNREDEPERIDISNTSSKAIYCGAIFGPTFGYGHDLHISFDSKSYSRLGASYENRYHFGSVKKNYLTESQNFDIFDIEIYHISNKNFNIESSFVH